MSNLVKLFDDYEIQKEFSFEELGDYNKMQLILNNKEYFIPLIGQFSDPKNNFKKSTNEIHFTMLEKRFKKKSNTIKYKVKRGEGRPFAESYSCQTMNKILRHTFCKDFNYDIDMVNSAPTILLGYAKAWNIAVPELERYVADRENFLNDYSTFYNCNRDSAKIGIISLINDDSRKIPVESPVHLLYKEIEVLQDKVMHLRMDFYKKQFGKENPRGKTMAFFLQSAESKITQAMIEFCISKGIPITSHNFDGFQAYKEKCDAYDLQKLLGDLEAHLRETFHLDMKLSVKEMDMAIDVDWSEFSTEKQKKEDAKLAKKEEKVKKADSVLSKAEVSVLHAVTDEDCGVFIINYLINNEIIKYYKECDLLYVYDEKTLLFVERDKKFLLTLISTNLQKYLFSLEDVKNYKDKEFSLSTKLLIGRRLASMKNTIAQHAIYTQMIIRLHDDSDFIKHNFDKTPYLIPIINNRVVDIRTNTVRMREKTDYFTFEIPFDYNLNADINAVRDCVAEFLIPKNKIRDLDDEIHIDSFLACLGYFVSGYNNMKIILALKGPANGGKSTLCNLFQQCFGKFFTVADKKVVCKPKNEAVHNAELFPLVGTRVISCPELEQQDIANGGFLKALSGNDKYKSARGCGVKNQVQLILDCKVYIPTNFMFRTDDPAVLDRLKCFNYPNKFHSSMMTREKEEQLNKLDFASVIFYYSHLYYTKGITWSKQIEQSTKLLTMECDVIMEFYNNNYEYSPFASDRINRADIYDKFKELYPEQISKYGKVTFYKLLDKHLPKPDLYKNRAYSYIKIKKGDACDSDVESIVSESELNF